MNSAFCRYAARSECHAAALLWLVGNDAVSRHKADAALAYIRRAWAGDSVDWEQKLRYISCGSKSSRGGMDGASDADVHSIRNIGQRPTFGWLPSVGECIGSGKLTQKLASAAYRSAVSRVLDSLELRGGDAVDNGTYSAAASRAR